jgi:type I restriction enzyme M protein
MPADQFRANSGLKAQEYSGPILGLIFLRFAEVRFAQKRAALEKAPALSSASSRCFSRVDEPAAYHAEGILYLAPEARFDTLLMLPERADIGARVNAAMREIERHNPPLVGVLPKTYKLFTSTCSRRYPRFRLRSMTTPLAASTNISSARSP